MRRSKDAKTIRRRCEPERHTTQTKTSIDRINYLKHILLTLTDIILNLSKCANSKDLLCSSPMKDRTSNENYTDVPNRCVTPTEVVPAVEQTRSFGLPLCASLLTQPCSLSLLAYDEITLSKCR